MKNEKLIIGILGGMGTYATINLFQQYAEIFPAHKEWERPRIIIDNNCTMPSRVRAILYNENKNILIKEMSDSIKNLIDMGAKKIILGCNTSHVFLPYIYEKLPYAKKYIVNIIDVCIKKIINDERKEVYLLATEGTILSDVYGKELKKNNIKCITPQETEFPDLRKCIEAVKQNKYSNEIKEIFINFMSNNDTCILGCTELPILYKKYKDDIKTKYIYDPLFIALNEIKNEFNNY